MEKRIRSSEYELIKIIAIFSICLGHSAWSIYHFSSDIPFDKELFIDISIATTNWSVLFITIISYLGKLGNDLFMICSAWFLFGSQKRQPSKIIKMLANVWVISVLFLAIFEIGGGISIPTSYVVKSLFPTTFSNNWYITCYALLYLIHPWLNTVIDSIGRKEHLVASIIMFILYMGVNWVLKSSYMYSNLILFISVYFIIAYIRKYVDRTKAKNDLLLILLGSLVYIGSIVVTDVIGLKIQFLNDKLMYWYENCNPGMFLLALGIFNLIRKKSFKSKAVNYISSLSLLVYLIHDNIMLRIYVRPAFYVWVSKNYGLTHPVLWVIIYAFIIFIVSVGVGAIYKASIERLVNRVCDSVYLRIKNK